MENIEEKIAKDIVLIASNEEKYKEEMEKWGAPGFESKTVRSLILKRSNWLIRDKFDGMGEFTIRIVLAKIGEIIDRNLNLTTMENKKWKGTTGEFSPVFTSNKSRAIRNEGGIVCTITKPDKYLGQDERFEKDLVIEKCNQELILDAFNTIQKCDMMPSELLENFNEVQENFKKILEERDELLKFVQDTAKGSFTQWQANQLISKIKGHESDNS